MLITTVEELRKWAMVIRCVDCQTEAREMLRVLTHKGITVHKLVFDTECLHHAPKAQPILNR